MGPTRQSESLATSRTWTLAPLESAEVERSGHSIGDGAFVGGGGGGTAPGGSDRACAGGANSRGDRGGNQAPVDTSGRGGARSRGGAGARGAAGITRSVAPKPYFGPFVRPEPGTHRLMWHLWPFAGGAVGNVAYGNLLPRADSLCDEARHFGHSHRWMQGSCSHFCHVRVVCKWARQGDEEDWIGIDEARWPGVEACAAALDAEAKIHTALACLQGQVIPTYYGVWKTEVGPVHAYQDLGRTLNQLDLSALALTELDKQRLMDACDALLHQLHANDYAHCDIRASNISASITYRDTAAADTASAKALDLPPSPPATLSPSSSWGSVRLASQPAEIQLRLLDFTHAVNTHRLSADKVAALRQQDLRDVKHMFYYLPGW